MIIKRFERFVSMGNLGLSSKEVHCSSRKLTFPWGIIMSLWRRSLSCLGEQLKLFFLGRTIMSFEEKELKLPWGTTMCLKE
jgi:hypothetical protein